MKMIGVNQVYRSSKFAAAVMAGFVAVTLGGCAATQVALSHKDLDVQTKMSNSIFLDPVSPTEQTVYVQIHNTTDKTLNDAEIAQQIEASIQADGYRITTPSKAHYLIQANILQVAKTDPSAASNALSSGFGGAIIGAAAVGQATGNGRSTVEAGLLGGLIGTVADSLVKNVTYVMITDLQLSVHSKKLVQQTTTADLQNGSATSSNQNVVSEGHWIRYRTRIVSTANQVNLKFADALPKLEAGLSHSVSGLL